MIILICVLAAIVIILLIVSFLFLKMSLKETPTRKDDVQTPLQCTDQPKEGDELRDRFIANRTRLRAEGAEFDKTLSPVQIVNRNGLKLFGRYRLQEKDTHKWVICIHGYRDDHRFMLPYVKAFYEAGYNVFTQDNRAHGMSDGAYISMGWLDKDDVWEWLDTIRRIDPEAVIAVHGVSMGAATAMMLSGLNHPAVCAYVEDCGYTTTWEMFKVCINRDYHLPTFPILDICNIFSRIKLGFDFKRSSALDQILKCTKPMMFIHGECDDFIPPEMCHRLYESYTGEKELYIAPAAGHAESMDYDPDEYFRRVENFIANKF